MYMLNNIIYILLSLNLSCIKIYDYLSMLIVNLFSDKNIFNLLSSLFMVNLRVLSSVSLTLN